MLKGYSWERGRLARTRPGKIVAILIVTSRDSKHLEGVTEYIEHNPVKAGLAGSPGDWR